MGLERILIPDQDGDRPRWAPDGKRFAFLSNKEGGSQVWIADFDAAAGAVTGVHKLTTSRLRLAANSGRRTAKTFSSCRMFIPNATARRPTSKPAMRRKLEEHEKSKVKALIFDRLLYRHWNAYKEGKRSHIFVVEVPSRLRA